MPARTARSSAPPARRVDLGRAARRAAAAAVATAAVAPPVPAQHHHRHDQPPPPQEQRQEYRQQPEQRHLHPPRGTSLDVRVTKLKPGFYLVSESSGNLLVLVGKSGSFVAGVQSPTLVSRAKELLRSLRAPRVRYSLTMESDSAPAYRDGGWGRAGAVTLAHEMLVSRMEDLARRKDSAGRAAPKPRNEMPELGFSRVVQVQLKDADDAHLVHDRPGYTDADVIIHFERAGLLTLGHTFTSDGYPKVDLERGGSVNGIVRTVDFFLENFPPERVEPIVPGRGPVATLKDLRAYREMLTSVRDRVKAMLESGKTAEQAVAAKPSAEFDARWGRGPVTPEQFVAAVYASVEKAAKAAKKPAQ